MMKRHLPWTIVFGLLAATSLAHARIEPKAEEVKGGATPEEAVAILNKAASAGDFEATFAVLVDEQAKPLNDWMKAQISLGNSIDTLADALDTAFGKDETSPIKRMLGDPKTSLARSFANATIIDGPTKLDDETVTMKVKSTAVVPDGKPIGVERTMKAKKTPTGWKLLMDIPPSVDFPRATTIMDQTRACVERTTKGVKDGSIKDRAAAITEMKKDLPRKPPATVPVPPLISLPD